jgi:hypothetical protein
MVLAANTLLAIVAHSPVNLRHRVRGYPCDYRFHSLDRLSALLPRHTKSEELEGSVYVSFSAT